MNNVVVMGLAKSGTTALFYRILRSWPEARPNLLFEPKSAKERQNQWEEAAPVLAKLLIGPTDYCDYSSFSHFPCVIHLVRDPRDRLISRLLYNFRDAPPSVEVEAINQFVNLLEQKEANPRTVSVDSLVEMQMRLWYPGRDALGIRKKCEDFYVEGFSWESRLESLFHKCEAIQVAYEKLFFGDSEALEDYLGFPLKESFTLDPHFDYIERSKAKENWRHWFTSEDVARLKPVYDMFLEAYGYDSSDWRLEASPDLEPLQGSRYVQKLLSNR